MSFEKLVAFDKKSARRVSVEGFLHVTGCHISKATVNPYYGEEIPDFEKHGLDPKKIYQILRPADELEKAASTFNNLPLMDVHVEVSAFDLENPEIKKHVVGSTGQCAEFKAPYLNNDLVIWTAGAIEGIKTKELVELSCAYRYELDLTPGTFEGQAYDGLMKNIAGNHVALVEEGRAGHDVVVADAALENPEAQSVVSKLLAIKEEITEKMKPDVEDEGAKILDDLTGAIDVAVHHLLDFQEEQDGGSITEESEDENPDGVNQYSGAAAGAASASNYAKANPSQKNHNAARVAHLQAGSFAHAAGKTKEASAHRSSAIQHANEMRKSPLRDSITVEDIAERKDATPKQGITEYGKVEFADQRNHKYPLDTPEHVRSASGYWGRTANQNKYSQEDQAVISKRIDAAKRKFKIGEYAETK